jgi:UDP-galactopyranose mutase
MPDTAANLIVCLSHLGWEPALFQRPQQIMKQFSEAGQKVLFVGCVGWKHSRRLNAALDKTPSPNLEIRNIAYAPGPLMAKRLRERVAQRWLGSLLRQNNGRAIIWLYHPELISLVEHVPRRLLVYDIMDKFEAFQNEGSVIRHWENRVLQNADVIFTGGRSLQSATEDTLKRLRSSGSTEQPATPVCFPSGVDISHFERALDPKLAVAKEIKDLPEPLFGYFGAIDERMDYDLIALLATSVPSSSVVLVGPILKAPPASLPGNVHLFGAKNYQDLPSYLKGFDVCLIPFRQSDLVAHISPTKTPEYLAGGKPVVSTAIPDVIAGFSGAVAIAHTAADFVECCRRSAALPPPPSSQLRAARDHAQTWEQISLAMNSIVRSRCHE